MSQQSTDIPLVENGKDYPTYTGKGPMSKYRTDNVGWRLAKRKELCLRKKKTGIICLALAASGFFLMVLETELTITKVRQEGVQGIYCGKKGNGTSSALLDWKSSSGSVIIKLLISISTVALLVGIAWYYLTEIKLFMVDNSVDDWRLALSRKRITHFVLEILICLIHPLPGDVEYCATRVGKSGITKLQKVPIDAFFSLPMFLRVYLLFRVMVLTNRLFSDARSQSLGALNRINFDFKFLFKSEMTSKPVVVQTCVVGSIIIGGSWALRACEMYHPESQATMLNSMWLIVITFLTVGYGDYTPGSYCGRTIAVTVGMLGVGSTALVVAVLARKLELSRAEKYVHSFVIDVELDKRYKHAAANILREGWLIYRAKKKGKAASVRKHQRVLLHSIHKLRDIKEEQHRMTDSSITVCEMARTQEAMHDCLKKIISRQGHIEERLLHMGEQFGQIDNKLNHMFAMMTQKR